MDLRTNAPRSPNDKLAGLVSLPRMIDKARAYNGGTLGEYHFDCPHDRPVLQFIGIDGPSFAAKVKELGTDEAIAGWLERDYLSKKSAQERAAFNEERKHWHPDAGSESEGYFNALREQVAPGRNDIVTWFDVLDLDEKRPVSQPTTV